MYTILILILVGVIVGVIVSLVLDENIGLLITGLSVVAGITCSFISNDTSEINGQAPKGVEVATPAKYTNQTYYIDNSNRLYIQQNDDTTKQFGGDISSKIEYSAKSKEPSIKFKTVKIKGDPDDWIPFKHKEEFKTSVSKVILPKSDLTGKLTKVTVLNNSQSASDLSLSN